ncbi:hypothetical protein NDU88_001367 [Pleurodeles waltl]|uniref:CCHC-type domain-containing protein n=1 Tax=Pleurodeles waltl TaxID=8319 RepID=A0AAV7U7D1_PLEWA|nr:hypothetical protein NDU88_001367 [Pleurodeles waltl]
MASKADLPITGTSAGKAGEQKAPGPKQGNTESPAAAKPGGKGKGKQGTRQGTAPESFNGYNLTHRHAQVMRLEVKDKAGPKLDRDLFLDKVIKLAGIPGEEMLSCQASASGWIFLLSFITHTLYSKYWEFFQGKKEENPFNISTGWEPASTEKRITVEIMNPQIPDWDLTSLLQRYGTIAKKDPPRKCQAVGHKGIHCPEKYCRICRQTGHEANGCTGKKVCNLCGGEGHTYYQCPKSDRPRTYAAAGTPAQKTTRPKLDPTANAKVNALLEAFREEAQNKAEPTRRSNPRDWPPRTRNPQYPTQRRKYVYPQWKEPQRRIRQSHWRLQPQWNPPTPKGTPEKGAPTDAPPLEAQGEPQQMQATGAEEGKGVHSCRQDPDPHPSPSKSKKEEQTLQEEGGQQQRGRGGDRDGLETGRKRQRQRKEDFYTTKKKHITSQAEDQNNGYTTIDTDEENIEDTGGIPGEQN